MEYTIKSICSLLDIKPDTLRKWEMRYYFLSPRRTDNRYRYYDAEDLERIVRFRELCISGKTAQEAAEEAAKYHSEKIPETVRIQKAAWKAFENLDRAAMENIFNDLLRSRGLVQSFQSLWVPILEKVGECGVSKDPIWIAKEHFFVACLRDFILNLPKRRPKSVTPEIVLAAPEGDSHELGIIVASLALLQRGVCSLFLGANMPIQSLCDILRDTGVRRLCLTITNSLGRSEFKKMTSQIKRRVPGVQLYFAGQASIPLANLISESGCVFLGTHTEIAINILIKKMGRK